MTPMTLPSSRIGALIIFWMVPAASAEIFTVSKMVAWREFAKLFSISGRLSRAVRAARAELLDSGIKPAFFMASGPRKCRGPDGQATVHQRGTRRVKCRPRPRLPGAVSTRGRRRDDHGWRGQG